MFKNNFKIILFILILLILSRNNTLAQNADNNDLMQKKAELEQRIKEKNEELKKINEQLQNTQTNLENVQKQKTTLQNEIKKLNETVKQLELNIAADTATIEKLKLEIDSLNYDIQGINLVINKKRDAIIKTIQEIQKSQDKNFLAIILSNNSLADSFSEIQNFSNLKNQLKIDIENLSKLQNDLNNKLKLTQDKKEDIEIRKTNLTIKQSIIKDQQQEKSIILSQTRNQENLYQKQLAELQKQQDQLENEIYQMEEELRKTFNMNLLPSKAGIFDWPIKLRKDGGIGILSQKYGNTQSAARLYRSKFHNGIDIAVPVGTPIYAAYDGIVKAVGNNDRNSWAKYQYGKYILIEHSNNLATLYAHLSSWVVFNGQQVKKGQLIGYSGNTGYSTGPHLHFGVYWAPSIILKSIPPAAGLVPVGVTINPEDYLP